MMDEREDRLDAMLRDAARDYNAPPEAPKAQMWERIEAVRQAGSAAERQRDRKLPNRRTAALPLWIGVAALLALGVAIGRLTVSRNPAAPAPSPTLSATPGTEAERVERVERSGVAAQMITTQHLGQVESFLTEFDTRRTGAQTAAENFPAQAEELLSTTRLLLDSKRLTDPGTRKLLEDLELVLIQIATLNPQDPSEELEFIADGLSQSQLRSRLRNAIPAGPVIRM